MKFIILFSFILSIVLAYDGPAIVSQNQNILRSYGNLGQVSTYSKTLETPFTSVRKSDVRVTNPSVLTAPTYAHIGYPGLVATTHHGGSAFPGGIAHTNYIRPAIPAVATYHQHIPSTASYSSPTTYGKTVSVPSGNSLLGVAYSVAPAVSHMSFSNGLGLTYEW